MKLNSSLYSGPKTAEEIKLPPGTYIPKTWEFYSLFVDKC